MTRFDTPREGAMTWMRVVVLLITAADRGYAQTAGNPAAHSTALWAHGIAAQGINLIPPDLDEALDDLDLGEIAELDMAGLILAAEAASRTRPLSDLPAGAQHVISDLQQLARAVTP